jgi:ATP-dependent metalloprotease
MSRLLPTSSCNTKPATFVRPFHLQWNFRFKDYRKEENLSKEADLHPLDADKQASLLKQVNTHNPAKVIERVESGQFANNEGTLKEYVRALYKENKLDQMRFSNILAVPNIVQSPNLGFNTPMRVQYVRNKWENFAILAALAGVLLFVWTLETGRESSPAAMFNVSSTHRQINDMSVKFHDVMGADEAKAELQEIVEYLRDPMRFSQVGAKLPKGVLMCGPPGTGKTLLARAMAGEAGVPFLYCAGSAFDEVYVGVGSKRVRQLFQEAAANAPCIVFIDEIDAVGNSRETSNKDSTLQQLLTELDGFGSTQGVVVIAATNTPETLDPALVRPGRFDRQVFVPLPDVKGRKQIFDMYLKKVAASDVDSELLARSTPGFSGADINQLINASAIKAVISGKEKITMDVIDEAKDDVLMGRMRKSVIIDQKTREITAYHEGGHALVAHYTEGADPVHKATIIQRGSALGMVKQLPVGDQLSYSRQQMEARLAVLMAGRAAEDLICGRMGATSGASSDLKQASKLATKMVKEWGFSDKVGMVYIADRVSPQTELVIDQEIHDLLHRQYEHAKKVLLDHREELDILAKALLDKETLSGEDMRALLEPTTVYAQL